MSIIQRIVLLLKVLVMLSLGTSAAWAECTNHDEQAWSGQGVHSELMLAASESGSSNDDDSTDDPDSNEDDT
ncbi:hypothetical protein ACVK1X_004057 [Pseudomonas sp. PvR086]|uniref:Secreted protein n=1 Tax=Pseudomonas frederiksbergensis TaxID=104087 RepID=A0AB33ELC6_9PSED|nr:MULTISPECIES: hypothetical protein [Pseudomonas]ATE79708.1 hypothetical protein CNN82_26045 [Pseudomonas frederiksbergensis]MBD9608498.1 hypothetical protein [Pseudomonas sp. PDM08]MDR7108372.1 hypothetical protein [Pseudomonas frederiksbergensis]PMY55786.1 hypothetical protein C1X70_03805 [Pseudomonas sp. FW305-53]PMY87307.1 hypothetical protein C1X68_09420 [Pseudomonas sp. FW303-C2]